MATIFINYRRQDSRGTTFALREKLLKYFDDKEVFMDIEGLDAGEDFVDGLAKTVSLADVMIVMIGRDWLNIRDSEGNQRLFKDDDFVRIEIASAISQGKKILPVLLEGTQMPDAADLPDDMKDLARRNAVDLRLNRIEDDARVIAEALRKLVPSKSISQRQMIMTATAAAGVALVVGTLAGPFVNSWSGLDWGPDESKVALGKIEVQYENLQSELDRVRATAEQARKDAATKLDEAKQNTRDVTADLRQAKAEAASAREQARKDLQLARSQTAEERARASDLRDIVDALRTDLKEAEVTGKQHLQSYREARGDILERNRENRDLTEQVWTHKTRVASLQNESNNLCTNFDFTLRANPDAASTLIQFMMKEYCDEEG